MTSRQVALKVHPDLWDAFQQLRKTKLAGFATDSAAIKGLMVAAIVGDLDTEVSAAIAQCPLDLQDQIHNGLVRDVADGRDPRPRVATLLANRRWIGYPIQLRQFNTAPPSTYRTPVPPPAVELNPEVAA